jgi:hypothetical protein
LTGFANRVYTEYNRPLNQSNQKEIHGRTTYLSTSAFFWGYTAIAFVSDKSRVLASVLSVVPLNVTLALWFTYTNTDGNAVLSADFSRMVLFGLIPALFFVAACWFGFRHGSPLGRVLAVGYAVWLAAMGLYRAIEWGLKKI